mmetsp:Transcript_18718/g.51256  ORF Transcript_18718/g.51256 Transcript_18718/m.51256 type:complete len:200 (+) Transcript_18718:239-838(+)
MKVIIAASVHLDNIPRKHRANRGHMVFGRLRGGHDIVAVVGVFPFGPHRLSWNRPKGKPSWSPGRHDTSESFPMRSMLWIGVKFARTFGVGIMIAEGAIEKGSRIILMLVVVLFAINGRENAFLHVPHDVLYHGRNGLGWHELARVSQGSNALLGNPGRGSSLGDGSPHSCDNGIKAKVNFVLQSLCHRNSRTIVVVIL